MKKTIIVMICIILIILLGVFIGLKIYDEEEEEYNTAFDENMIMPKMSVEISYLEVSSKEEEKTTPNTLIIYKTYYTKCKHYVKEYKNIDASLVNCTEDEIKEKCRGWRIEKFSVEEIEMAKEEESFCNQHYKLILENNVIVIYNINEDGIESEYEQTGITTEYLTNEDILKLTTGIYVYGKENLTSTIEDYE